MLESGSQGCSREESCGQPQRWQSPYTHGTAPHGWNAAGPELGAANRIHR